MHLRSTDEQRYQQVGITEIRIGLEMASGMEEILCWNTKALPSNRKLSIAITNKTHNLVTFINIKKFKQAKIPHKNTFHS